VIATSQAFATTNNLTGFERDCIACCPCVCTSE